MPTATPELEVSGIPNKTQSGTFSLPQSTLDAINKAAGIESAPVAPEPPKPAAKPEPVAAKPEPVKPEAKPETPPAKPESKGIASVREALERKEAELAKANAKAAELEASFSSTAKEKADAFAKIAELEGQVKGFNDRIAKEFQPQIAKLTEVEKKLQEREEALRIRDFTATDKWHNEYVKPIAEANNKINQFLTDIGFVSHNGQDVPATVDHFNAVYAAPNGREAMQRAQALFGPDFAAQAVSYRAELRALQARQQEALKNAQLESTKYFQEEQQRQAQWQSKFKQTLQERESEYEKPFRPDDKDAELLAAYQEGQKLADEATYGSANLDPERLADVTGNARATIKEAKVMKVQFARLKAENETLKKQLAEYQSTEPDVKTRTDGELPEAPDTKEAWREQMLAAARKAAIS